MNRKVDQVFVTGFHHLAGDELRAQHAVATFPRYIVAAVNSQPQFTGKESHIMLVLRESGEDDGTMFVVIAGEEMGMELGVHPLWNKDSPWLVHGRSLSHRRTFCNFMSAVSVAGFSRLERRDSWIAEQPRNGCGDVPAPRGFPSARQRSSRTKCG